MIDLERLDAAIRESGKTRTHVCGRIGKPPYYITDIFRRKTDVPADIVRLIASELGVTAEYLCGEEDISSVPDVGGEAGRQSARERGVKIPVYGQVAAGIPIDAITDIEDYEEIPASLAATGRFAALRIHGDSMEPRIWDGDIVIVRLQETADTGDTAIVLVNGDTATCKKIKKTPEGVMLISTNPRYEPLFYSNREIESLPIRIWGRVIEVRGKM